MLRITCIGALAGALLGASPSGGDERVRLIPVRVIKSDQGLLDTPLEVSFVGDARGCRVSEEYFGDNPTEAYFDIIAPHESEQLPRVRISWPGATVKRVLVGHTPVEFDAFEGGAELQLVDDTRAAYAMHAAWTDVPGCRLTYMHKPRARRSGPHRDAPWSEAAVRAEGNLMFAALEVFQDLRIGDLAGEAFEGVAHVIGYETTFPRRMAGDRAYGHSDYPPHLHVFLVVPPGWRIRQATHFYIAADGTLTGECRCQPSACDEPAVTYHRGEYSAQRDFEDRVAFEVGVTDEGYLAIRREERGYTIRPPAGDEGFAAGAEVWCDDQRLVSVLVSDDCPAGRMTIRRTYYQDGAAARAEEQVVEYDPELGTERSRKTHPLDAG